MRRQGSGTYVGRATQTAWTRASRSSSPTASWPASAGSKIELGELSIEQRPLGRRRAALFGADPGTSATTFTRVLLLDGRPGAWMRDVVHPDVELPSAARLRQSLEAGEMVLDVLLKAGRPGGLHARAHQRAPADAARPRSGRALGGSETTAALEIEHVTCDAEGAPVEHSDGRLPARAASICT